MVINKQFRRFFSKQYASLLIKLVQTKYWRLFPDIDLSFQFKKYKSPKPNLLTSDEIWDYYEINGFKFYWPAEFNDSELKWIYKEIFTPHLYNPHAYVTNKIKINKEEWVLDIGACEGFFTYYALQQNAKVLAIEPVPTLADALKKTFEKEILEGRVIVMNVGIGKVKTTAKLHINNQQVSCSSLGSNTGQTIPIMTLDDIFHENIIPAIDFIKMDIEGGEIDAINGADEIFKCKPKMSIAVYHSYQNAEEIKKILLRKKPDYKIFFRGIFYREKGELPRPYMLYAI